MFTTARHVFTFYTPGIMFMSLHINPKLMHNFL